MHYKYFWVDYFQEKQRSNADKCNAYKRTCENLYGARAHVPSSKQNERGGDEDRRRLQSGACSVIVPEAALSGTIPQSPPSATATAENANAARYSMRNDSK